MPPLQGEGCISMFDAGGGSGMYFRCARQGAWTPSDAQIAELEEVLRQNAGQRPGYARHYAGVTEGGRRIIRGVLVDAKMLRQGPGVYVESEVELPAIDDGGCWVVHVTYDPSNREMTWRCGYTA